jgi:hypothetical protein
LIVRAQGPWWVSASIPRGDPLSDLLRIPKIDTMGRAHIVGTCRQEPVIHPVVAKVTLLRDAPFSVKGDGTIRAWIDAGPTPVALIVVEDDDSVVPFGDGLCGARLGTRRIVAVPTGSDAEAKIETAVILMRPLLSDLDELDSITRIMLLLACHLTGHTPPACILVDHQRMRVHGRPPFLFSGYILHRSVRTCVAPMAGSQFS